MFAKDKCVEQRRETYLKRDLPVTSEHAQKCWFSSILLINF